MKLLLVNTSEHPIFTRPQQEVKNWLIIGGYINYSLQDFSL